MLLLKEAEERDALYFSSSILLVAHLIKMRMLMRLGRNEEIGEKYKKCLSLIWILEIENEPKKWGKISKGAR